MAIANVAVDLFDLVEGDLRGPSAPRSRSPRTARPARAGISSRGPHAGEVFWLRMRVGQRGDIQPGLRPMQPHKQNTFAVASAVDRRPSAGEHPCGLDGDIHTSAAGGLPKSRSDILLARINRGMSPSRSSPFVVRGSSGLPNAAIL